MSAFLRFTQFIQKTFALWVVLFAAIALIFPEAFVWLKAYITWMLGIIMFGMGMTMTVDDFKGVVQSPKAVGIGVVAQFVLMPGLAYLLCKLFQLPPEIAIGVILVGCCPGGTASNVITYMYGQRQYRVIGCLYFGFDSFSACINTGNFLFSGQPVD